MSNTATAPKTEPLPAANPHGSERRKNPTLPPKNLHITSEPVKKNMLILLAALVCWYRYLILLADLFVGLVPALSAATAAAAVGGCRGRGRGRGGGGGVFVGPPAKPWH